ncbi:MAG: tannase/feruloyl esterase family alpha/beta hydrolase [Sphingopyxis sp.]|uniref:tannase/feruloyl esterase family alpha/beta hydrolase n=1 Tax=Sphingopyxis sp. TaxID=1908224 RepID=UPI001A4FC142|nr:tannase/feruloyl esterase family alpha/beta hydrolase [Sphingopyxis sp.]MBL9070036.1 tannase/feruloyl esterase family alpha/beta hydrolase [Sphingopyxis sp.]
MRGKTSKLPDAFAWLPLLLSFGSPAAGDFCADLAGLAIDKAVVANARLSDGICMVDGSAHPVAGSDIRFTVYLPAPARWSGRYYQIGNGGFAGAIHLPTLDEGARRGDAIAATDTGHRGTGFDARWAADNPVALADYGWRSIKATRDAAQAIVGAYYHRPPAHRYFMGCSNGGRMALMAAARWPEDWDGILAGAPANPWTVQLRGFDRVQRAVRAPGAWLGKPQLELIRRSAIAACPARSVRNGIAQRPNACRPDWDRLTCRDTADATCLSPPQRASLQAIINAGYVPAAMDVEDWERWVVNPDIAAPSQLGFAEEARQHLFGQYDTATLSSHLDVLPEELEAFRDHGGKILSYFGWADAVISPELGLQWYRSVERATNGPGPATDFYRLFMVPGMLHCQGGMGAVSFGQSIEAPARFARPAYDVRLALEQWAEKGQAPRALKSGDGNSHISLLPVGATQQSTGNGPVK